MNPEWQPEHGGQLRVYPFPQVRAPGGRATFHVQLGGWAPGLVWCRPANAGLKKERTRPKAWIERAPAALGSSAPLGLLGYPPPATPKPLISPPHPARRRSRWTLRPSTTAWCSSPPCISCTACCPAQRSATASPSGCRQASGGGGRGEWQLAARVGLQGTPLHEAPGKGFPACCRRSLADWAHRAGAPRRLHMGGSSSSVEKERKQLRQALSRDQPLGEQ